MSFFSTPTYVLFASTDKQVQTEPEKWTLLVFLPIIGTILFYLFPDSLQQRTPTQFLPQVLAYVGFGLWAFANGKLPIRLGIQSHQFWDGIRLGCLVGLALGVSNTIIILMGIPALGGDITFLARTPHAHVPTIVMLPWIIIGIAIAVEFNFRGFILGRLITLISRAQSQPDSSWAKPRFLGQALAIITSALLFAFDPFMVATFQHLHWIAVWDGIIWAWICVRFTNLYATIVAHAVEVIVLYSCIKIALT